MRNYTNEINAAVRTLGELALEEAKRVCPVKTGRLKRSISKRSSHDRAKNSDSVTIFTNVPYAANVEFGGLNRKPKPFLETGLEKARQSAALVFTLFMKGEM